MVDPVPGPGTAPDPKKPVASASTPPAKPAADESYHHSKEERNLLATLPKKEQDKYLKYAKYFEQVRNENNDIADHKASDDLLRKYLQFLSDDHKRIEAEKKEGKYSGNLKELSDIKTRKDHTQLLASFHDEHKEDPSWLAMKAKIETGEKPAPKKQAAYQTSGTGKLLGGFGLAAVLAGLASNFGLGTIGMIVAGLVGFFGGRYAGDQAEAAINRPSTPAPNTAAAKEKTPEQGFGAEKRGGMAPADISKANDRATMTLPEDPKPFTGAQPPLPNRAAGNFKQPSNGMGA